MSPSIPQQKKVCDDRTDCPCRRKVDSGKKCKYADFIHECQEAGWEAKYFRVEAGSRGFTNKTFSMQQVFEIPGHTVSNKEIGKAILYLKNSLKSHWLARSNTMFESLELVERPEAPSAMQLESEGPRGQSA